MPGQTADVHAQPAGDDRIKIWFRFVPREGWLPYDTEGLWGTVVSGDTARIDNVPFLQDGVAQGDVVRFHTDPEGVRWARERVVPSGNCTVRVLPKPGGPLGRSARAVHDKFAPFGIGGEVFSDAHFGIAEDDERVNPWGGAIAIGHPLASSGVRLMTQLSRQFAEHPEVRYGLTAMCIGIGMGGSVIWENPNWEGDK